jgi:hypothetical protein
MAKKKAKLIRRTVTEEYLDEKPAEVDDADEDLDEETDDDESEGDDDDETPRRRSRK